MSWTPSFRTKFIFFGFGSVAILAFCLILMTLYAIDTRKREIVSGASELVHLLADQLTTETARLRAAAQIGDAETLRHNEQWRETIGLAVSSSDGVLVVLRYNYGEQQYEYIINPKAQKDLGVELRTQNVPNPIEAGRDLFLEGSPEAKLVVKYVPEVLLGRIEEESRQITVQLAGLAGALTLFLALALMLVWRLFRRHIERERAHEHLDRMAYVGTLASGLAHEIRNPLNAMSLNLDVVNEELEEPQPDTRERTRKIVGLLKSEVNRLNATLTNFLHFALPAPRRLEMTDVVAVLNETAVLLGPEMRRARIKYHFEGERSCVTLADPSALRQVFWNVLLNAIQALHDREDRRIESRCRVDNGVCRIEIRDTGPGVPPDRREQVFEVFHSNRRGGSGFGLAIARQVIERLGGSIRIDSLDGWGCVVHIHLPLRIAQTAAEDPSQPE